MKRPTFCLALLFAIGVVSTFTSCDLFGGGGSETETRSFALSGRVVDTGGTGLRNVQVTVWPDTLLLDPDAGVLPKPVRSAISDDQGDFGLDSLPKGTYRVYYSAEDVSGMQSLTVDGRTYPFTLPRQVLTASGSLAGKFDSTSSGNFTRYVQVYGLPRYARCDAGGAWSLNGLPAGTHRLKFVTREPFREPAYSDSIPLSAGSRLRVAHAQSRLGVKLVPQIDEKGLRFAGVGPGNPILLDNELCDNTADLSFLLPVITNGGLNVRGWIVTKDYTVNPGRSLQDQIDDCREVRDIVKHSGYPVLLDPVGGSSTVLVAPASGRLIDMQPEPSAGVSLILTEAAKATPEKPLVILVGGPLSTVASAFLLNPSIVTRVVVVSIYADRINARDSLANQLVAQKFRFIHWGRGYAHSIETLPDQLSRLPTHASGLFARSQLQGNGRNFGDLPLPLLLLEPRIYSGATAQNVKGAALKVEAVPAGENGDFWDIEKGQTDFDRMARSVYDSLASWPSPSSWLIGVHHALTFASSNGAKIARRDSTDSLRLQLPDKGSATYRFDNANEGVFVVNLWARNAQAGNLRVSVNDSVTTAAVPASSAWRKLTVKLGFPPSSILLKLQSEGMTFELKSLDIAAEELPPVDPPVDSTSASGSAASPSP